MLDESPGDRTGHGVGLANVRRRLVLCYGAASDLDISSVDQVTTVRFQLPAPKGLLVSRLV